MIRLVHIFIFTVGASLLVLLAPRYFFALNDLFGAGLIIAVYFLQRKRELKNVDVISAYGLAALNICNLLGNLSMIPYGAYMASYLVTILIFSIILIHTQWKP